MLVRDVQLETVCGVTSTLPSNQRIEVAFAGKSNVGKSSLLNALVGRRSIARTSAQPGKTQTINFYRVDALDRQEGVPDEVYDLYLVDLPGYGYAKASEQAKAEWGRMIERYLHTSKQLQSVFLLIDIRHAPGANDVQMYNWVVSQGYRPVIIATKLDKIKRGQVQKQTALILKTLQAEKGTKIIPFSAETKQGREEIWNCISRQYNEYYGGDHE